MRPAVFALTLVVTPFALGVAQTRDSIVPGMQVRFRPHASGWITGRIIELRDDLLILARAQDTLAIPIDDLRRLEANFRGGFRHEAALKGALRGAAFGILNVALSTTEDTPYSGGELAVIAATPALAGYLYAGGGTNARRGALIGMLAGIPVGIVIVARQYEPCSGGFLCFSEGFYVAMGALMGAGVGSLLGGTVGALVPGDHWERVSKDRLRVNLGPRPDGGVGLGATFRF